MASPDSTALHEALGRWAADHASRYAEIGVLDYEPDARPEQRIETSRSPVETTQPAPALRATLVATMGEAANSALTAISTPGVDGVSPRDALASALAARESVAVLVSHAGGFEDMGVFAGSVAVALEQPELIARNGVIVNKVMTRETYAGHPIRDLYRYFANVYWVIPDTENMARWGLDDDLARSLNVNATRTLVGDMKEGMILTVAPGGSAMRQTRDASGALVSLEIPAIASGTVNLLSRFDDYMCGASWQDAIALGPLRPIERWDNRADREAGRARLMQSVLDEMAALTEELAGVPVTVEEDNPAGAS